MTDGRIIAYLLDELPEEEAEQFEEYCFAQEDWPEQINLIEENLIYAYLRGELSPEQREHFERNYLTTEARREHVLMTAALLRQLDIPEEETSSPVIRQPDEPSRAKRLIAFWNSRAWGLPAVAALGLVVVIVGAWWLLRLRTSTRQTVATLTLTISNDRERGDGARPVSVRLPPDVDALSIQMRVPEQATASGSPSRVELLDEDGVVSPLVIETRDAGAVAVIIPATRLKRGPYSLRLFTKNAEGAEQRVSGLYFFVVE
jgi:hypothetical protein